MVASDGLGRAVGSEAGRRSRAAGFGRLLGRAPRGLWAQPAVALQPDKCEYHCQLFWEDSSADWAGAVLPEILLQLRHVPTPAMV
jgi:hypothetical protein